MTPIRIQKGIAYTGAMPNFDRDQFATRAAMKAYSDAYAMDDGHIVYCVETGLHYEYKSTNTVDQILGKFRAIDVSTKSEATLAEVQAVGSAGPESQATSTSTNWLSVRRLADFVNSLWTKIKSYIESLELTQHDIDEAFDEVYYGIESYETLLARVQAAPANSTITTVRIRASFTAEQLAVLDGLVTSKPCTIQYGVA